MLKPDTNSHGLHRLVESLRSRLTICETAAGSHNLSRFAADRLKSRPQLLGNGQRQAWTGRFYWLAVATVIGLVVTWQIAHLDGFRWNVDEGIDLMKAELVRAGYPLYTQTYSDQPPGLTIALVVLFNLVGTSIEAGRLVVVVFTSAGLLAVALLTHELSKLKRGPGALVAVLMLALVPNYFWLSRAIMISVPSAALGALACALTLSYARNGRRRWLVSAGLLLGASLVIKLITLFLVVPLTLSLLLRWSRAGRPGFSLLVADMLILGGSTMLLPALALLPFDPGAMLHWIISPILQNRSVYKLDVMLNTGHIYGYILDNNPGLFALALYGLIAEVKNDRMPQMIKSRARSTWVVGIWLVISFLTLLLQTPLWSRHHLVVLLFPAVTLACVGLDDLVYAFHQRGWNLVRFVGLGALVLYLTGLPQMLSDDARLVNPSADEYRPDAVRFIRAITRPNDVLVSDDQIITFYSRRPIPPNLSNTSAPRMAQGNLPVEEWIETTERYSPRAIVLWQMTSRQVKEFQGWVKQRYRAGRSYANAHFIYVAPGISETLQPLDIDFDGQARLTGLAWDGTVAEMGQELCLVMDWQLLRPATAPLSVVVHLLDAQGHLWASLDREMWDGQGRPTTLWESGTRMLDGYALKVPANTPPGSYQVTVTLYAKADPPRYYRPQADLAPDGGYPLATVEVRAPHNLIRDPTDHDPTG